MKKIIAAIAVIAVLIVGYNLLFLDSSFEKDLKESLPYDLIAYTLFDSYDSEYKLEVKDFTVDRHVRNGNYDTADCTIVLEDNNIKKTVYVTLYSTKYNNGWQVDNWTENHKSVVIPKYAPDSFEMELEASEGGYVNLTERSEDSDYSDGFFSKTYSTYDVYDYVTFTGDIIVNAEFVEEYNSDISCYGWKYSSDDNTSYDWTVGGIWNMVWNDGNINYLYKAQKTIFYIGFNGNTYGNAICYHYPFGGEEAKVYEDDELAYKVEGYNPDTLKLSVKSNCVEMIFTCDTCEAYIGSKDLWGLPCQNITRE